MSFELSGAPSPGFSAASPGVAAGDGGVREILRRAWPLLLGVSCLTIGLGLLQTLIGLRASREGFPAIVIGLMMSGYFAGYLVASRIAPALIAHVGHLRTFAALAAAFAASTLIHAMAVHEVVWIVLRVVAGFCLAGVFVVTESWLNGRSTNTNRGSVLGAYSVLIFGGMALGQLLLNTASPSDFRLFSLVAVLAAGAVVPISLSRQPVGAAEQQPKVALRPILRSAPLSLVTAVATGLATGSLLTLGAVYARDAGLAIGQISILLSVTLLAGVAVQVPIGRLSDRIDRRVVIAVAAVVATGAAATAGLLDVPEAVVLLVVLIAIHGACSLPMYSLALAHLQDRLLDEERTGAGGAIVLVQGLGAAIGPMLASVVLTVGPSAAFLWYLAAVYLLVAVYAVYRISRWAPVEVQSPYEPIASGATPVILSVTPDELERHPWGTSGDLDVEGVRLHYRHVDASGTPLVLVHDLASSSLAWQHQLGAFARAGHTAIAYDLRGHGRSARSTRCTLAAHVGDLRAVVERLAGGAAHLVGQGGGAAVALAFTREHPALVRTLTLVAPVDTLAPRGSIQAGVDHFHRAVELTAWRTVGWPVYARRLAAIVYDSYRHPERRALVQADALQADPHAVATTRRAANRAIPRQQVDLGCPVLLVVGARDPGAPLDDLTRLRSRLAGHELAVVEGAGRFVGLDMPHELDQVILEHVARADETTSGDGFVPDS